MGLYAQVFQPKVDDFKVSDEYDPKNPTAEDKCKRRITAAITRGFTWMVVIIDDDDKVVYQPLKCCRTRSHADRIGRRCIHSYERTNSFTGKTSNIEVAKGKGLKATE